MNKTYSPRNKTIRLTAEEQAAMQPRLAVLNAPLGVTETSDLLICQDMQDTLPFLPDRFVDLLFIDPPYNLTKSFNGRTFRQTTTQAYMEWLEGWLARLVRLLKPHASIYICGDWQSAAPLQLTLEKHFTLRNRITWEREKGRGAKRNWKNASEDIWFATLGEQYTFNVEAVKLKRRVIAPYVDAGGAPKDWQADSGGNFRLTYPSNIWADLSVPFWSMAENTGHPTQKPEKLLAKIILASSNPGDMVFDPFCGSGTALVTAKKLGRAYCGIEIDPAYACLAQKRLDMANNDRTIQGYDGVFWERNSGPRSKPTRSIQ